MPAIPVESVKQLKVNLDEFLTATVGSSMPAQVRDNCKSAWVALSRLEQSFVEWITEAENAASYP